MSTHTHPHGRTRQPAGSAVDLQPRHRDGRFGQKPHREADTHLPVADRDADPAPDSIDWADAGWLPPLPDPTRREQQAIDRAETDQDCPPVDDMDFDPDAYGREEDRMLEARLGPW